MSHFEDFVVTLLLPWYRFAVVGKVQIFPLYFIIIFLVVILVFFSYSGQKMLHFEEFVVNLLLHRYHLAVVVKVQFFR